MYINSVNHTNIRIWSKSRMISPIGFPCGQSRFFQDLCKCRWARQALFVIKFSPCALKKTQITFVFYFHILFEHRKICLQISRFYWTTLYYNIPVLLNSGIFMGLRTWWYSPIANNPGTQKCSSNTWDLEYTFPYSPYILHVSNCFGLKYSCTFSNCRVL